MLIGCQFINFNNFNLSVNSQWEALNDHLNKILEIDNFKISFLKFKLVFTLIVPKQIEFQNTELFIDIQ